MSTAIQWTDVTDNIIVAKGGGWWCRKISPGCAHCYAAALNQNDFFGGNHLPYSGEPPELVLREEILAGWKSQRKAKRHFVASMTDVFGEWVPQVWVFQFMDAMAAAPLQTFQVLTKRAEVMHKQVNAWLIARGLERVPVNIWLGVSVENQEMADLRVPKLLNVPAVRFLSVEPLLGKVNLSEYLSYIDRAGCGLEHDPLAATFLQQAADEGRASCPRLIDWVIVGGESGPMSRACNVEWIRSIVKQCKFGAGDTACFVKQLGANPSGMNFALQDKKGGNMEEWPADLRLREFPPVGMTEVEA